MKKLFSFMIGLFTGLQMSDAQITFQKTYSLNAKGNCVQITNDGGYIVCGYKPGVTGHAIYLFKTDANGDTLWTKTFGISYDDQGNFVQQTKDNGYIIVGSHINPTGSGGNIYLIKTNSIGDTLWTKSYGGNNDDVGNLVEQTKDSGYIITGYTKSFGVGNRDLYLIRTDMNGDTLWTRTLGGDSSDVGTSVQETSDSNYIVAGYSNSFGANGQDVYLIKMGSNGDTLWTKTFGGIYGDAGFSVQENSIGEFIIMGFTNSTMSFGGAYIARTSSDGDLLWRKSFNSALTNHAYSAQQTNDGGYVLAGNYQSATSPSKAYLLKTDITGNIQWAKLFGVYGGQANSVQQTNDSGYIITGYFQDSSGIANLFLVKTDSNGNNWCNQTNVYSVASVPQNQSASTSTIISSGCNLSTPSMIISNGGTPTTLCFNVGIDEIKYDNSFLIFPNPSLGNFTITTREKIKKGTVQIFSVLGEKVFEEIFFNSFTKEINLKNISGGLYFVIITDDVNKNQLRAKLVVE